MPCISRRIFLGFIPVTGYDILRCIKMMNGKYHLCNAFGIPIHVDFSFVFLLVIFTLRGGSFTLGIAEAMVLAISVILHELGHSLTARAFGYHTTDITISLLGGCASMIALPRKAIQEFLTAIAGPLVSFAIAGLSLFVLMFVPIRNDWLHYVVLFACYSNAMLGVFNLLPGFPMDGGRIFRSFMRAFMSREKATYIAMIVGRGFAILLALRGVHSIVTGGGWGIVTLLIAWMIWQEGWREYQMARADERFRSWSQGDFNARVSPPPYDL